MSEPTLVCDTLVDEPGLVGARWWQESVFDPVGRRRAILGLLAASAALGAAAVAWSPTTTDRRRALDLQRQYGWSFGAEGDALVFDGASTQPFDRERLDRMVAELAPRVPAHRPFYVPTLFEAPAALPRAVASRDTAPVAPLKTALRPIVTPGMRRAFDWAKAHAEQLATAAGPVLVVDLDGEDSVAFAAGASGPFDPVFLFDNWPHPHGVVPAHLTLAAAAYYQPMFAQAAQAAQAPRADASPMFVLDRRRLAPYQDDAEQFDNRWVARLPSAEVLRSWGARTLLYVAPSRRIPWELDDLNGDLVIDAAAGLAIVAIDASAADLVRPSGGESLGEPYAPAPRSTPFSREARGVVPTTASDAFGSVPVEVSLLGGAVLGVAWNRSGSWNHSGSWSRSGSWNGSGSWDRGGSWNHSSWFNRSGSWNRGWSTGG
ncbi:MAG: hypothetical protein JOZ69_12860 [Myxococcales bacterium]|nr:hypothetical protein [Myxococcales bacterium]